MAIRDYAVAAPAKDRPDPYTKGVVASSPGLVQRAYPGSTAIEDINPNGVAAAPVPQSSPDGCRRSQNHGGILMPQSLSCVLVHIVFSTKKRMPFLVDYGLRERVQRLGTGQRLVCIPAAGRVTFTVLARHGGIEP